MIRVAGALACLAVGCLIVQSVAALLLPAQLVPDLVLLVAVACALTVPSAAGMLVVALAGFGADLLSGALLGHHALLRLGAFGFTWAISAQFHLKRALPLMVLVFCLAAADALLQMGLTRLFAGSWLVAPEALRGVLPRAGLTALLAPLVSGLFQRVALGLTEGDRRREVRLDTRRATL